jgi:hypothetical protein
MKHIQQHSSGVGVSTRTIQVQLLYKFKGNYVVPQSASQPFMAISYIQHRYEKYMAQVASRKQLDLSTY